MWNSGVKCCLPVRLPLLTSGRGNWKWQKTMDIGTEMSILKECKPEKQLWLASISLTALSKLALPWRRYYGYIYFSLLLPLCPSQSLPRVTLESLLLISSVVRAVA